jgi:hypothetical protein
MFVILVPASFSSRVQQYKKYEKEEKKSSMNYSKTDLPYKLPYKK